MKNFFTYLAIGILIHVNSHAVPGASQLKIREIDHRLIRVQFNQGPTSAPSSAVRYENIMPGTHHVRVWVKTGNRRRDGFILAYNGPVHVPANSDIRTILHRNGQLKVFEVFPISPAPVVPCQPSTAAVCGSPFQFGMEASAFHHLLAAIEHSAFDQTRLQLASQAIASHGTIRTDQVESLMSRLNFESSRLALAKHAYRFTADPSNYHRLFTLFHFDSSVRELSSFIAGGGV